MGAVPFNPDIQKKITPKTKAIVIVHLYGYACDFRKIIKFCKKRKIKIIEDCAQALGAEIQKRKVFKQEFFVNFFVSNTSA